MITAIEKMLVRDLATLSDELIAFPQDADLWKVLPGVNNSCGNLCLHLLGNLNHFIGHGIGGNGYVRNREAEFGDKNIPRAELLSQIAATRAMIETTLRRMDAALLEKDYPILWRDQVVTYGMILTKLVAHLGYHLGQINYQRRMMAAR